jgi:rubrerythrin
MPALLKLDYSKYDSDKKLLELAKMREKHAVQYYEKYKHEVSDKIIAQVFEALANVEREHIILTSK